MLGSAKIHQEAVLFQRFHNGNWQARQREEEGEQSILQSQIVPDQAAIQRQSLEQRAALKPGLQSVEDAAQADLLLNSRVSFQRVRMYTFLSYGSN